MSSAVAKDFVVAIHYTVRDENKQVLDSSEGADPLVYLHGYGQIIPGLENTLVGKKVGEKLSAEIAPNDAYGDYDETLKFEVPKAEFPKEAKVAEGEMFEVADGDGESMLVRIDSVTNDVVTVNGNHPLAGKKLFFQIEIVDIRSATKEELEHGHAHGPGGHNH